MREPAHTPGSGTVEAWRAPRRRTRTRHASRISAATTRTRPAGAAPCQPAAPAGAGAGRREPRDAASSTACSRLLGEGGFGQVYLARRLGRSSVVPARLCIKVSGRIDAWLREAYFGQLLDGHPRAIRVFDAFPLVRSDGRLLYCLALEYARHGDLRAFLHRTGKGWPERTARREIAGILQVLGKLHRGQVLHRDLTPMNVFVCDGRSLKLGDFGLVRQQSDRRGATADALNPMMAPSDIVAGAVPKWQARDDVYQVGQLLGMLVRGDARARIRTGEIRLLPCSDQLKEIVYRCIGERRKRYETADELIEALRKPPASLKAGRLAVAQGRPPRVHRHPGPAPARGPGGGPAGRRRRARRALGAHDRRRARAAQPAAGGRPRRGPEADGDQAPAREGAQDHAAQRAAVLAPGGEPAGLSDRLPALGLLEALHQQRPAQARLVPRGAGLSDGRAAPARVHHLREAAARDRSTRSRRRSSGCTRRPRRPSCGSRRGRRSCSRRSATSRVPGNAIAVTRFSFGVVWR